ncbi:hypothetical protein V9W62_17105 [Bacillus velezensis]|uniref:hypothetical protein n=1 Tax=Bacillus velezensis TaxID=492670 RepID=UPI0005B6544E|nr:hypothetical protein [Bacillus velezensis]AWK47723.1 hypothetical protein RZ52_16925 [Bacillus velezensis]PAF02987.1 hypothetical protein CHH68_01525 [Bacillus velezensis]
MRSLNDYHLVSAYYQLLFTIDEGLCYLLDTQDDFFKTEGERIYNDLIQAFFHLDSSHALLLSIIECRCVETAIRSFDEIFQDFSMLNDYDFPSASFQEFLKTIFLPHYKLWMEQTHDCIKPYVLH